jgi:uncharacterized GH25 family protein
MQRTLCSYLLVTLSVVCSSPNAVAQGFKFLEVTVLDPDGKPLADVPVDISLNGMAFPMPTDEKGVVAFNVPGAGGGRVQLSVKHDGYLAQGASWNEGEEVPEKFTIPMKKGVPIGGIVHDDEGKPIEGVKIEGAMIFETSTQLPGKGKLQPYFNGELATTDKEGRWKIGSAPEDRIELQLKFSHPEYVSDRGYGFRGGTWEELRSLEKIVVMQEGIGVKGTVVDAEGKPVSGAKVGLGGDYVNDDMVTRTDQEGKYRISNIEPGINFLTVYSPNHAPEIRQVAISKDMEPVDFKLQPGHKLTFKVTDPEGNPVPGVGIAADTWKGARSLMTLANRGSTDAKGIWVWEHAPADAVQCEMFCKGYMSVRGQNFTAREEPYEITMPRALKVEGMVVDAESGEPVKTFSAVQGIKWDSSNQPYYWERYNIQAGKDGKFTMDFDEPREGHLVRIEAAGYRPGISRVIKSDEQNVKLEFKLEKGVGPKGIVRLPDGSPAAKVEVLMAIANNQQLYLTNGRYEQGREAVSATTDDEGRFELPFPEAEFKLVCLSDHGWGEYDGGVDADNIEITLQPWSKLTGVALQGDQPLANEDINLNYNVAYQQNRPSVFWSYSATTDANGKFTFDRLRSGTLTVARSIRYADTGNNGWMSTSSHSAQVELKSGEAADVQLGGAGRHVKGQMTMPKDHTGPISWNMGAVQLYETQNMPAAQNVFQKLGQAIAQSTAPRAILQPVPTFRRSYAAAFDGEGNFEVFDMLPGTYQMSVTMYQREGAQMNWNPVGAYSRVITVPGEGDETIDLGSMEIKMTPRQPVAIGTTGTLQIYAAPVPVPAE